MIAEKGHLGSVIDWILDVDVLDGDVMVRAEMGEEGKEEGDLVEGGKDAGVDVGFVGAGEVRGPGAVALEGAEAEADDAGEGCGGGEVVEEGGGEEGGLAGRLPVLEVGLELGGYFCVCGRFGLGRG